MSYILKIDTWGDSREELIKQVKDFLREVVDHEGDCTIYLDSGIGTIGSDPLDTPEARDLKVFWGDVFYQALEGFCSNSAELCAHEVDLAEKVATYAVAHYDGIMERRDAAILAALEVK